MSNSIKCEPFLNDYLVTFHNIFTPLDKSMNTSEIKPLHLSLPRNRQGVRISASPNSSRQPLSPTKNNSNNNNNNRKSEENDTNNNINNNTTESKGKTRFLSNHYLATKIEKEANETPRKGIDAVAQKQFPISQSSSQETVNESKPTPEKPVKKKTGLVSASDILTLVRNEDYWFLPLSPSMSIRLIFTVRGEPPNLTFEVGAEGESPLMTAEMIGKSRSEGIKIFVNGEEKGQSRYTQGNSSLYTCAAISKDENSEVCASVFNPSFLSPTQPRIFDFIVPALKKSNGRSRMLPIEMSEESSGLVARLSQMSKEAIRLKARIPASQGNAFDTTFDGKFNLPSLSNFVLYHDSNNRKDLCSLGMISNGEYLLDIGYPLSPLQGFLAAVGACATP